MTDKEYLELAAKAAGLGDVWYLPGAPNTPYIGPKYTPGEPVGYQVWNPITDDGDALRLAVKLNMVIWRDDQCNRSMVEVQYGKARGEYWVTANDPYASTRRAIVTAAAEIGKAMEWATCGS